MHSRELLSRLQFIFDPSSRAKVAGRPATTPSGATWKAEPDLALFGLASLYFPLPYGYLVRQASDTDCLLDYWVPAILSSQRERARQWTLCYSAHLHLDNVTIGLRSDRMLARLCAQVRANLGLLILIK